nr:MAG TPA: hypothetical protein [Caudoviricetes sp.]
MFIVRLYFSPRVSHMGIRYRKCVVVPVLVYQRLAPPVKSIRDFTLYLS